MTWLVYDRASDMNAIFDEKFPDLKVSDADG